MDKELLRQCTEIAGIQRFEMDKLEALGKAFDIIYNEPEEE